MSPRLHGNDRLESFLRCVAVRTIDFPSPFDHRESKVPSRIPGCLAVRIRMMKKLPGAQFHLEDFGPRH